MIARRVPQQLHQGLNGSRLHSAAQLGAAPALTGLFWGEGWVAPSTMTSLRSTAAAAHCCLARLCAAALWAPWRPPELGPHHAPMPV